MSPYAPMRTRSGGTDFDDIDDLRRELGARLDQEAAWKQEVQQQMKSLAEHERELARTALDEVRLAGTEAIQYESERARAHLADSQRQAQLL